VGQYEEALLILLQNY